ncbi:nose resistant to fluoxetine protein 6-like [Daphnia carinata]|uniref:nose resistant to fluoxetine protein 6-like n=1 Tax=Daphnia carinata TaxID=120202 RepID=UPI00257F8DF9|nr:nose resistant to fluoxetine protein 6-like [Daphnia carinata]
MDYFKDKYLFITTLLAFMISCNGQTILGVQHFARQLIEQESWSQIAKHVEDHSRLVANVQLEELHRELKTSLFASNSNYNYSLQCIEDVVFYVDSLLLNRSKWALEMLESSAQFPAGVFGAGNYHAEGLFDECLAVRGGSNRFQGQYCTVFFKPERVSGMIGNHTTTENNQTDSSTALIILNHLFGTSVEDAVRVEPKISSVDPSTYMLPSLGLCIPSSCSASDLAHSIAQLIGRYVIANQSIVTIADEKYCFTAEEDSSTSFSGPDIAVMATLGVIGLLIFLATAHESWRMYRGISFSGSDNAAVSVLHCFSALNNGRKVLSLKSAGSDNLSSLHGIRFFSTCWVVLGHTWLKGIMSNVINPNMVVEEAMRWEMETIINATVSVDSFFLMSGLLVSHLLLRELDRNEGKFNVLLFYVHRYLRLTPVYAIILGFIATLMVYIGTGPNWYNVIVASEGCRVSWWRQFLYINNLFPTDMNVQCMGETWYIAVDMQLFIIAPLLIYPLWRWKNTGLILLAIVTLATLAANFAVFAIYSFPPTLMPSRMQEMMRLVPTYMDNYYFKPWTRAPPYLIGIWTGWFLHRVKQSKLHVSPWIVALLWTLSGAVAASIIYGLTPYVNETLVPTIDDVVKLTYGPLHRAAWALALAWTIVACIHGYGGFINRFLSWRGFLPLSRLTYCVYLIHFDYLNVFYSSNRKMIYYSFIDQLTTFFGITVTVFALALIVSVCVEAPFINFERWLFKSHVDNAGTRAMKGKESRTDPELNANNGHVNSTFHSEENPVDAEVPSVMKL